MPITEGDVLFSRVETELAELLTPGVDTSTQDIHTQIMAGLDTDNGSVDSGDDSRSTLDPDDADTDDINNTDDNDDNDSTDDNDDSTDDSDQDVDENGQPKAKPTKTVKTDKTLDQNDPEYKEALKVKGQLEEIFEKFNLTSLEDLVEILNNGTDIQDILGDLDLNTVLNSHKTLEYYNQEWAKRDEAKKKENETPEETIKRLEQEKQQLLDKDNQAKEAARVRKEQARLVTEFDETVDGIIESDTSLDKDGKRIVRQLMGINNPSLDIKVTDKRGTIKSTNDLIKMLKERDTKIAQQAIDDYSRGKSKIPVKNKPKAPGSSKGLKAFTLPKNASPSQALAFANKHLIDIFEQAQQ